MDRRADKKTERRSDSFLAAESFASIRLKGESPVMRLSDAPPEEEELSKGEIMESWRITCISRATCSFQKQPKMVNLWNTTATAPVTPFDQIIRPADHCTDHRQSSLHQYDLLEYSFASGPVLSSVGTTCTARYSSTKELKG